MTQSEEQTVREDYTASIEQLRTFPARLRAVVTHLSDAQLTTAYIPGEWTVAQNVHHLVDSHSNSVLRMKHMLTENQPTLRVYEQDAFAVLPDGTPAAIENSLALLTHLHERWAVLLSGLTAEQWQRQGIHPESGVTTVAAMLDKYIQHGDGHIEQIQRTLAAAPAAPPHP